MGSAFVYSNSNFKHNVRPPYERHPANNIMNDSNEDVDFKNQVALYRQFDDARQRELEGLANKFGEMKERLQLLEADLEDEKKTRQDWRKRAQDAEGATRRSQFVLVLVDGDGYIFKDSYLRDANESGGARAAHDLSTDVQDYLRERNIIDPSGPGMEVMINVYANRFGLAKHLCDAEAIQFTNQLDQFFQSFTQSKALVQFIDCGYGKERADAKLRDTFRFYAYNVHCKHIFLACCHDNGYVAELDKYRHDAVAAPKTILVHSTQMGRGYNSLNFPIAHLSVFNTQLMAVAKKDVIAAVMPPMPRMSSLPAVDEHTLQTSGDTTSVNTPSSWSAITAVTSNQTSSTPSQKAAKPVPPSSVTSPQLENVEASAAQTKGIPINRQGQRIDLRIAMPTNQDLEAFEDRIANRKLCNRHHLANDCYTYNCRYDHDPITPKMKNTLRHKARSIPCQNGPQCRDAVCFYGHQCPWGRDKCANSRCAFVQKGMHDITDIDIAKYVPAEAY